MSGLLGIAGGCWSGWMDVVPLGQAMPTELYLPEGAGGGAGGVGLWVLVLVAGVVLLIVGAWAAAMKQRRVDPRELAFRALSKKLGLSRSQMAAIRAMGAAKGMEPVGLLLSPSAVRAAAGE